MGNVATEQIQIDETRIQIDETVTTRHQVNNAAAKLNRNDVLLSKIRHFKNFKTHKSIYHAISESHFKNILC